MEAKELRIGNYIRVKGETDNALFVRCLDGKLIRTNYLSLQSCEFEPIPLTEEWLVRFGVKISNYYNVYGQDNTTLTTKFFSVECSAVDIKYVHQLQNLYFALTGEELELK